MSGTAYVLVPGLAAAGLALAAATCLAGTSKTSEVWPPANAPVNRWVLRTETAPNIVWENGVAWDPDVRRVVWHGGHIGRLYPQSNYTFLYDPARNRFTESQSLLRPQRRCLVFVAYADSCRRTITLDGGVNHGSLAVGRPSLDYTRVWFKDALGPWLYDAVNDEWEDCRPLPPEWVRNASGPVCYEPGSDAVFGLRGNNLCIYSLRTNRVSFRPLPADLRGLNGYGLAADPVHRALVVFGGSTTTKRQENGKNVYTTMVRDWTWVYDVAADSWKPCGPKTSPPKATPGAEMPLQMIWHDASGTVLLMQNVSEGRPDNSTWPPAELWSFSVATEAWTLVPMAADGPRPAFMGRLAYDREDDLLIVFGGGRDGTGERGRPGARPGLSRSVWTGRVAVPGASLRPNPERITVTTDERGVRIAWAAETGVKYEVFRAPVQAIPGAFEKITSSPVAGGSYEDRAVERGKVYAYEVAAAGAARRSLPGSNQPWRPAGLLASVESAKEVRLTWRPNAEPDLTGYHVYRARGTQLDKAEGDRLTPQPIRETRFTDSAVDLADGVIRTYWVTAVNRAGIESGASPLAHTVPDAPFGLVVPEGVSPSDGVGNRLSYTFGWQWPDDVKVAGFNVYHATEHIDTLLDEGGYEKFFKLWTKVNDKPVTGRELVFPIPKDGPANHYFYVRAVNVLGQEGFYSDLVSPTDRRFRP